MLVISAFDASLHFCGNCHFFIFIRANSLGVLLGSEFEEREKKRRMLIERAKSGIAEAYSSEEYPLMQAISTYLEIDKIMNLVYERLNEWYSLYFPELKLSNPESYARFVVSFGMDKKKVEKGKLAELLGSKAAEEVARLAEQSMGREPNSDEYVAIKEVASNYLRLSDVQKAIDAYLAAATKRVMPNVSYIIDYHIAAELLGKAGSLEKLATMPSSTIQLLGAEKAFFKHLKYGSKSPKYGIIFKLADISNGKRELRGKIARVYANKISIAAKADAFSKRFIADELKAGLESAIKRIQASEGKGKEHKF